MQRRIKRSFGLLVLGVSLGLPAQELALAASRQVTMISSASVVPVLQLSLSQNVQSELRFGNIASSALGPTISTPQTIHVEVMSNTGVRYALSHAASGPLQNALGHNIPLDNLQFHSTSLNGTGTAVIGTTSMTASAQTIFSSNEQGAGETISVEYQLVVPPGWLAVRINESEYFGALERLGDAEPAVQKAIASILSEDPAIMRLFAFDLQPEHIQGGVVSSITVQWNQNDAMSLASDADLQAEAERLRGMIAGAEILDVKVEITPGGIQHGLLSARWPATTATGSVVLFQKQAFLKFGPGRLVVTLLTTDGMRDTLVPAFDEMIREVELVAPQ